MCQEEEFQEKQMAATLPYGSPGMARAVALCQKMPLDLLPCCYRFNGRENAHGACGRDMSLDGDDQRSMICISTNWLFDFRNKL